MDASVYMYYDYVEANLQSVLRIWRNRFKTVVDLNAYDFHRTLNHIDHYK